MPAQPRCHHLIIGNCPIFAEDVTFVDLLDLLIWPHPLLPSFLSPQLFLVLHGPIICSQHPTVYLKQLIE